MISEWSAELTLTEESSKALFDVLHQQDLEFINGLLDGKHGFTLQSSDGRSVELVPAPKWIPCSERLPELSIHCTDPFIGEWDNSEPVLIYHKDKRFECEQTIALYTNGFEDVGKPVVYGWVEVEGCEEIRDVTAWMPLPKPWKGADDETAND